MNKYNLKPEDVLAGRTFAELEAAFAQARGWVSPKTPSEMIDYINNATAAQHVRDFATVLEQTALAWLKSHPVDNCSCDGNSISLDLELYRAEDYQEPDLEILAIPLYDRYWIDSLSESWREDYGTAVSNNLTIWLDATRFVWLKLYHEGLVKPDLAWTGRVHKTFIESDLEVWLIRLATGCSAAKAHKLILDYLDERKARMNEPQLSDSGDSMLISAKPTVSAS